MTEIRTYYKTCLSGFIMQNSIINFKAFLFKNSYLSFFYKNKIQYFS